MTKFRKKTKNKKPAEKIQIVQSNAKLVNKEAKFIIECAQRGDAKVVTLGHHLLFFSTFEGDAWLLDTEDKLARVHTRFLTDFLRAAALLEGNLA
jgi:hypothetical protein